MPSLKHSSFLVKHAGDKQYDYVESFEKYRDAVEFCKDNGYSIRTSIIILRFYEEKDKEDKSDMGQWG